MIREFENINSMWSYIASSVLDKGCKVDGTLELSNIMVRLNNINENVLTTRHKFSLLYYLGESVWYGSGANDVDFISRFGKIWEKLTDDGVTNNSAYGHILKNKHGFNQIEKMIELLKVHPESRRAVMNINTPRENVIETKDEFCTIALQLLVRDGKLNMTGIMRSNDLWSGTPYDIFYFTEIQKYIANQLGLEYGTYTHCVTSLHIYDRNIEDIGISILNYLNDKEEKIFIDGQKLFKMSNDIYKELKPLSREETRKKILEICEKERIVRYE